MTNNLFDPTFQLCMSYYFIEINGTLLIFNISLSLSLIYKLFFCEDAFNKLNEHEFPLSASIWLAHFHQLKYSHKEDVLVTSLRFVLAKCLCKLN